MWPETEVWSFGTRPWTGLTIRLFFCFSDLISDVFLFGWIWLEVVFEFLFFLSLCGDYLESGWIQFISEPMNMDGSTMVQSKGLKRCVEVWLLGQVCLSVGMLSGNGWDEDCWSHHWLPSMSEVHNDSKDILFSLEPRGLFYFALSFGVAIEGCFIFLDLREGRRFCLCCCSLVPGRKGRIHSRTHFVQSMAIFGVCLSLGRDNARTARTIEVNIDTACTVGNVGN
jgi:hypothetical protein